jgi:predicted dienelactone hydrolase
MAPMQRRDFLLLAGSGAASGAARGSVEDAQWTDAARGRALPVRLRWPDGTGPCALVLHSHGLGGNRNGAGVWGEAWSKAGFAVLHLQHPGSDTEVVREGGVPALRRAASAEQLRARVADAAFALDEIGRRAQRGDAPFARLRLDAIGMSGHSFGAITVQALAGQRSARPGDGTDPRIRAFVAFSPSLGRGLDPKEQFARVTRPFLAVTGSHDGDPLQHRKTGADRAQVYDALPPGRRALLWIDGADHATFGGGRGAELSRRAARLLDRHPDAVRDEAVHQERIARVSAHWWRHTLLGEPMRAPAGLGANDRWRMD